MLNTENLMLGKCPFCGHLDFHKFEKKKNAWTCKKCQGIVISYDEAEGRVKERKLYLLC